MAALRSVGAAAAAAGCRSIAPVSLTRCPAPHNGVNQVVLWWLTHISAGKPARAIPSHCLRCDVLPAPHTAAHKGEGEARTATAGEQSTCRHYAAIDSDQRSAHGLLSEAVAGRAASTQPPHQRLRRIHCALDVRCQVRSSWAAVGHLACRRRRRFPEPSPPSPGNCSGACSQLSASASGLQVWQQGGRRAAAAGVGAGGRQRGRPDAEQH